MLSSRTTTSTTRGVTSTTRERENENGANERGRSNNVDGYELHASIAS